jgi:hypothetical protein
MMNQVSTVEISKPQIPLDNTSASIQTNGISVDNLIGGLHLNLTQPECNTPAT